MNKPEKFIKKHNEVEAIQFTLGNQKKIFDFCCQDKNLLSIEQSEVVIGFNDKPILNLNFFNKSNLCVYLDDWIVLERLENESDNQILLTVYSNYVFNKFFIKKENK